MTNNNHQTSLYTPLIDALLLGGASVICLILLRLLNLSSENAVILSIFMLCLANFVNHPHFFHSYQIFYGSANRMATKRSSKIYQFKWAMAAYVAPAVLMLALAFCAYQWLVHSDAWWMGGMLVLMAVLVGWHYVKQGFGMAMLDAAFKKCFWSHRTKRLMLINAYCCWGAALALIGLTHLSSQVFGFVRLDIALPQPLTITLLIMAFASTLLCMARVVGDLKAWRIQGKSWAQLPLTGLGAYMISIYLWTLLVIIDPIFALVVPFFHSLQYMSVVYRLKINEKQKLRSQASYTLIRFFVMAFLLGFLGFAGFPVLVDYFHTGVIPIVYQGVFLATASCWIFINIHHYFIDSVIWRKDNAYVQQNLYHS